MTGTTQESTGTPRKSIFDLMAEIDVNGRHLEGFEPIAPNEVIIGVLSENLQRLIFVVDDLQAEAVTTAKRTRSQNDALANAHRELHAKAEIDGIEMASEVCEEYNAQIDKLRREETTAMALAEAAEKVFWGALYVEYPNLAETSHTGVREGFVLVTMAVEREADASPSDMGPVRVFGVSSPEELAALLSRRVINA